MYPIKLQIERYIFSLLLYIETKIIRIMANQFDKPMVATKVVVTNPSLKMEVLLGSILSEQAHHVK